MLHIAALSDLHVPPEALPARTAALRRMLAWTRVVRAAAAAGGGEDAAAAADTAPRPPVGAATALLRPDVAIGVCDPVLGGAGVTESSYFVVPRVLEENQ